MKNDYSKNRKEYEELKTVFGMFKIVCAYMVTIAFVGMIVSELIKLFTL